MIGPRLAAALAFASAASGCTSAQHAFVLHSNPLSDAQQVIADTKINWGEMTIQASADRDSYDAGQPIGLSVTVSKDAHLAILRVLASGETTIVFPNKRHPSADVAAGRAVTVPGPGDAVTIAVDKPQTVLFEFIASTSGDPWLFHRAADKDSDFADLGSTTRALSKDFVGGLKVGKGPETVATYLMVKVGGGGF